LAANQSAIDIIDINADKRFSGKANANVVCGLNGLDNFDITEIVWDSI